MRIQKLVGANPISMDSIRRQVVYWLTMFSNWISYMGVPYGVIIDSNGVLSSGRSSRMIDDMFCIHVRW